MPEKLSIHESNFTAVHQTLDFKKSFADFSQKLESTLGRITPNDLAQVKNGMPAYERLVHDLLKGEQLIIFGIFEHGAMLSGIGQRGDVKQYLIGNPLTALSMTRFDRRAALYAPLRVLVGASENGGTQVEYDLPSSLFGQFGSEEVLKVAKELDAKLLDLLKRVGA